MKIAMVRTSLHKGSGQVTHIKELSKKLMEKGHEVTVFMRDSEVDLQPVSTFPIKGPLGSTPFIRHFTFTAALAKAVDEEYDLIHTQYHPEVIAGSHIRTLKKIPHVFTYHGFAPVSVWKSPRQMLKMIDHRVGTFFSLRSGVDHIITVSNFLRRELEEKYMVRPNKIHVIYNGVDLKRFNQIGRAHV